MGTNMSCENCKHREKDAFSLPCRACRNAYKNGWEPEDAEDFTIEDAIGKVEGRPKPLPEAVPYYEHDESRIPERIRISFSDGSTALYSLDVKQPAPVIIENIKIIRRMKQGYVNQPMRRRKRK